MDKENINGSIYFLWDYNWTKGTLLKVNTKTYKIFVNVPGFAPHERNVVKEKCAFPDEKVCVVWETWRGVNGRGGYRVERIKYPNKRILANQISRQHCASKGRVME